MQWRCLFVGVLLCSACVSAKVVGDNVSAGDSGDSGDSSMADTAGNPDSGVDTTAGPQALCPDNPDSCPDAQCESSTVCGSPLSKFDDDGCVRPRCDGTACPQGRTCVSLGDYGACAESAWSCELADGVCGCGGTADCSEGVSICVPDAVAPDPADKIPTVEEFQQLCAEQSNEDGCVGVQAVDNEFAGITMFCTWNRWVPIALDAADACQFGTPTFECNLATASEAGCESGPGGCEGGGIATRSDGAGGIELTNTAGCLWAYDESCLYTDGMVTAGPAECICSCDPGFPA